jgi:hypothetical protein
MNSSMFAGLRHRSAVGHAEHEGPEAQAVVEEARELVLEGLGALVREGDARARGALAHALLARLKHHGELGNASTWPCLMKSKPASGSLLPARGSGRR